MAKNSKLIAMDGSSAKTLNPWDLDNYQEAWTSFSGQPQSPQQEQWSRVAAAFRAFNLKANTVAGVPFSLFSKSGEEYDNSNEWENKVKFLPNPQEILRLDTLSLMASNTFYNLKTSDALGYRTRGLYNAIFSSFTPYVNPVTAQLDYIERRIGSHTERYTPDDKRLIRAWRLDHTTEVLPSQNTEAKAILSSAGIIANQDAWVEHFYKRGGIKATLVALKGLIQGSETKEEAEKGWSQWLKGIGKWFGRPARIYNAEAIDIKPIGAGVDDMKDNKIYEQAIANIAMGTGMPLSLLLANSANYATAQEEKATWYDNDIIPMCKWIAFEYNRQLWEPLGFYMQFQPQTLDPNQQDETEKADAISQYIDIIVKCPTYDLFIGMADTIGIEISDTLDAALKKYYADKEAKIEQGKLDANGQVIEAQPVDEKEEDPEDEPEEKPAKWIPSLNHFEEMRVWREVSHRRNKKGESLDFEYHWHKGGLPDFATEFIKAGLLIAATPGEIDKAFDVSEITAKSDMLFAPAIVEKSNDDILALAAALNRNADAMFASAGSHKESDK
jgi:hypothetical protein